jgi:ASCH domain
MMKALSVRQPWAWLIANGFKDIENRSWDTSYRGLILIHAGKQIDTDFSYVAANSILGWSDENWPNLGEFNKGGIIGYAYLVDVVTQHTSPWFEGPNGFVLKNAHPLFFIPMPGQLGLFDVTSEIEAVVKEEIEKG